MIDLPIGKALIAVEDNGKRLHCRDCAIQQLGYCHGAQLCGGNYRKDGKNVIFKLVDLPKNGIKGDSE
ncbi:hypothetical protein FACS1894106_2640 [Spirochaetia bacterium]|nr:hypothetical protein FACS1894106_2640 [Spirochaetia bacterium]